MALPDAPLISNGAIAAAEMLAGVSYTESERTLMRDKLAQQVELVLRRRAVALPAALGPATRFDPRLPGYEMPRQAVFAWAPASSKLPESDEDIAFAPLTALAGWIHTRQLSTMRLTRLYLDRIARLNPMLLCFARITAERALHRAAELDAMAAQDVFLGPLHGIPYGMKDIIDTAGIPTEWGAEPYQGRVPEEDAHITQALERAGAVLLGKTSVGALAYGDVWTGGRTRNPWNFGEGSSGSSAGSASATAAGLVGFAIGTETLGSIVSPSTRCGTVGLRPTFGRISRRGAMPLCWSLDKIGPICRAVEDTALVLQALNTPDPQDAFQLHAPFGYAADTPLNGLRLGYHEQDFADAGTQALAGAQALDRAALEAARGLGVTLVPLQRRELPYDALMGILLAEAAAAFEELTLSGRDDELTRQDAEAWPNEFRRARFLSAVEHVQLDRLRRLVMEEMDTAFRSVDLIIGPSLVGPMLVITNFTGHPCLCLPSGHRPSPIRTQPALAHHIPEAQTPADAVFDVPHAICLWGKLFHEGPMLALGQALERQLGAARRPPL